MANRVSMEDIAKAAGVTRNTVSLALRDREGLNQETKERILDIAEKMGYDYKKKNQEAGKNVLLLMPQSSYHWVSFFTYIQFGIEEMAKKNGLHLMVSYYDDQAKSFIAPSALEEGLISAIIAISNVSMEIVKNLDQYQLPLIVVDSYFEDYEGFYVLTDNINSAYQGTKYLVDRGHQRIGFVGNIHTAISYYDRYMGYLRCLEKMNLPNLKEWQLTEDSLSNQVALNMEKVKEQFRDQRLPTAFFCCNDYEAAAMYKVLRELGLKIPEDVAIIGFDDSEISRSLYPELTSVRVNVREMGRKAVEIALELMKKKKKVPYKMILATQLIERGSV
jgi:DNA-binding LacI/PurR family transcriptional regulator